MKKEMYLITGAEGSGKTMLAERAARSLKMKLGQIMTDSPNKSGAKNARVNLTSEDFSKQNCAITYIDSNGYHCGITEEELDNGDVFAVDFNALEAFRQQYHGERGIVTIGIASSAEVCRVRMLKRKEEQEIELAVSQGKEINAQLSEVCDRVVLNDGSFGGAKARLEQIILMNLYEDSPITKYFAYNTYASEWFLDYGITLRFIFGLIGNLIEDIYGEDTGDEIAEFLWDYVSMQSFGNETVKTADEFFETDYASKEYREELLGRMQNKYHILNFFNDRRRDSMAAVSES